MSQPNYPVRMKFVFVSDVTAEPDVAFLYRSLCQAGIDVKRSDLDHKNGLIPVTALSNGQRTYAFYTTSEGSARMDGVRLGRSSIGRDDLGYGLDHGRGH